MLKQCAAAHAGEEQRVHCAAHMEWLQCVAYSANAAEKNEVLGTAHCACSNGGKRLCRPLVCCMCCALSAADYNMALPRTIAEAVLAVQVFQLVKHLEDCLPVVVGLANGVPAQIKGL